MYRTNKWCSTESQLNIATWMELGSDPLESNVIFSAVISHLTCGANDVVMSDSAQENLFAQSCHYVTIWIESFPEPGFNKSCFWTNQEVLSSVTCRMLKRFKDFKDFSTHDPFNQRTFPFLQNFAFSCIRFVWLSNFSPILLFYHPDHFLAFV